MKLLIAGLFALAASAWGVAGASEIDRDCFDPPGNHTIHVTSSLMPEGAATCIISDVLWWFESELNMQYDHATIWDFADRCTAYGVNVGGWHREIRITGSIVDGAFVPYNPVRVRSEICVRVLLDGEWGGWHTVYNIAAHEYYHAMQAAAPQGVCIDTGETPAYYWGYQFQQEFYQGTRSAHWDQSEKNRNFIPCR